jgi:hypothetical protein
MGTRQPSDMTSLFGPVDVLTPNAKARIKYPGAGKFVIRFFGFELLSIFGIRIWEFKRRTCAVHLRACSLDLQLPSGEIVPVVCQSKAVPEKK